MVTDDLGRIALLVDAQCDEQRDRVIPLIETLIRRIDGALATLARYDDDPAVADATSHARRARDTACDIAYGWLGDYTRTGRELSGSIRDT